MMDIKRRDFLKASAALAATSAAGFSCVEIARRGADPGAGCRPRIGSQS